MNSSKRFPNNIKTNNKGNLFPFKKYKIENVLSLSPNFYSFQFNTDMHNKGTLHTKNEHCIAKKKNPIT